MRWQAGLQAQDEHVVSIDGRSLDTAMTIQIALIRGINVGGHQAVAMSDLRDLIAELGFESARSLLQSGNLLFRCDARRSYYGF